MIYRSGSEAQNVQDYAQGPVPSPLFPGGEWRGGAQVYENPSELSVPPRQVIGLEIVIGSTQLGEVPVGKGQLLIEFGPDAATVYRDGALLLTENRPESEDAWTLRLTAGTAVVFALRGPHRLVTLTNPQPGSTFGGASVSGGVASTPLTWPRLNLALPYVLAGGAEIDETVGTLYPGDLLTYVPPDYAPEPTGEGLRVTYHGEALQTRVNRLDDALISGGLLRVSPMLTGLTDPASAEPLPCGSVTYRLDDGQETLDVVVSIEASNAGLRLTLTVDGQTRIIPAIGGQLAVTGDPSGLVLTASADGAGASGVALERNAQGEVFLYSVQGPGGPSCETRDASGEWHGGGMAYVVPGGDGSLTDRRLQIRRSGGPYLWLHDNDEHARLLIFGGALDSAPDTFVSLLVAGRVRRYLNVGTAVFNPRISLLMLGE